MISQLSATGRNALADDGVERHAGKGLPSEVGAHHRARRSARVVPRVEGAARKHRNLERREDVAADGALLDVEPAASAHRRPGEGSAVDARIPRMIAAGGRKTRDPARRGHAGDRPKPARQLLLKGGAALGVVSDASEGSRRT